MHEQTEFPQRGKYRLVLFDWNGTLLDDAEATQKAINATFEAFHAKPPTVEEYYRELDGDYLAIYRRRGIEAERNELDEVYSNVYTNYLNEAKIRKDVHVALRILESRRIPMGLVTTQPENLVAPILRDGELDRFFSHVHFHVLNKSEKITELCRQRGIRPRDALYIGDTPSDVRHARKAGANVAVLADGFIPGELLQAAKPDRIVPKFLDILEFIL